MGASPIAHAPPVTTLGHRGSYHSEGLTSLEAPLGSLSVPLAAPLSAPMLAVPGLEHALLIGPGLEHALLPALSVPPELVPHLLPISAPLPSHSTPSPPATHACFSPSLSGSVHGSEGSVVVAAPGSVLHAGGSRRRSAVNLVAMLLRPGACV